MLVADNIEEHKSKLKFFMHKFCGIIKTMESTHKELSIAIRGYGFFAAVRLFFLLLYFLLNSYNKCKRLASYFPSLFS